MNVATWIIVTEGVVAAGGVTSDIDSGDVVLSSKVHCPPRIRVRHRA